MQLSEKSRKSAKKYMQVSGPGLYKRNLLIQEEPSVQQVYHWTSWFTLVATCTLGKSGQMAASNPKSKGLLLMWKPRSAVVELPSGRLLRGIIYENHRLEIIGMTSSSDVPAWAWPQS
jgi:hypothetical protein